MIKVCKICISAIARSQPTMAKWINTPQTATWQIKTIEMDLCAMQLQWMKLLNKIFISIINILFCRSLSFQLRVFHFLFFLFFCWLLFVLNEWINERMKILFNDSLKLKNKSKVKCYELTYSKQMFFNTLQDSTIRVLH